VVYTGQAQADPLPRQAKIGFDLNLGIRMILNNVETDLFKLQLSSEANDLLIKRDPDGKSEYQSFPGDINLYKNIISNESTSSVINRHGFAFDIVEIAKLSFGKFEGNGFVATNTFGYDISFRGILKLISGVNSSERVNRILPHFDLIYSWSEIKTDKPNHPINRTKYHSISLAVFGF